MAHGMRSVQTTREEPRPGVLIRRLIVAAAVATAAACGAAKHRREPHSGENLPREVADWSSIATSVCGPRAAGAAARAAVLGWADAADTRAVCVDGHVRHTRGSVGGRCARIGLKTASGLPAPRRGSVRCFPGWATCFLPRELWRVGRSTPRSSWCFPGPAPSACAQHHRSRPALRASQIRGACPPARRVIFNSSSGSPRSCRAKREPALLRRVCAESWACAKAARGRLQYRTSVFWECATIADV